MAACLDAERFDDDPGRDIGIAEALAVQRAKSGIHCRPILALDREQAVAPFEAQPGAAFERNRVRYDPLLLQGATCFVLKGSEFGIETLDQGPHQADLLDRLHRREADAIGGQNAGERMDQHRLHAQRIGDPAGVLAARTAETGQRIRSHVVPPRDADLADGIGHAVDRDGEEAFGDVLQRLRLRHGGCHLLQPRPRGGGIERFITARTEDAREEGRVDPPEEQVAVCHRQRAALAIAGGAGIGARAIGPNAKARSVELADRAAARRDGVDLHHRRGDTHARDHAVAGQLVLARVMRDVGAGPAHVEADQLAVAQRLACCDHADHAAGRTRKDRVLAAKRADLRQSAIRLHEAQGPCFWQARLEAVGIAPQDRR